MTGRPHLGGCLAVATLLLVSAVGTRADQLRNVRRGQLLPPFDAVGLDGKPVRSTDAVGKVRVLVYVGARQERSEQALASAQRVASRIGSDELKLIYMSAATDQADYFRQLRDRLKVHEPFALDEDRKYYGQLGLIVCPTTVIASKDGRLLHVIASRTRDYEHKLDAYCRHALGEFDDAELAKRLTAKPQDDDQARARADRHRAVAAVLRSKGMVAGALRELEQALAADPTCAAAIVEMAEILIAQGKLDDAEERLGGLPAGERGHPSAKLTLGLVKLKRGQLDDAERLLKEALAMNPDPVRAHYYLGELYERRGEYKLAMEHYRDALKHALKER